MPQLKPKPKTSLFFQLASPSAPGFSTIATSSRRQRRRHHVGKNAREWQPTPVLFPSHPRTPAPSQSRLRRAREPRSSGGPGSRLALFLLFQLHGDSVEGNAATVVGVEGASHCRSVIDRAAHTPSLVPMETTGRAKHAVDGKEEADGGDGKGGLHAWLPCR